MQPVSYASITQLNGVLAQLEGSAKSTQTDLAKLRIERWKADGGSKKQTLANVDSIQRNLQGALPEIVTQLRAQPEDLPTTFKLYRNLDALYDVLGNVVEVTGAFGSKDDFQSLANDLSTFEGSRKQLAQRLGEKGLIFPGQRARIGAREDRNERDRKNVIHLRDRQRLCRSIG